MAVAEMAGDSRAVAAHARRLLDGVILEEEQPPEEPEPEVRLGMKTKSGSWGSWARSPSSALLPFHFWGRALLK